jgi:hypothetical protein
MRLAEFITANHEPILIEWEAFARTCSPASGAMDVAALRDHAAAMLTVIAADLNTFQGRAAQAAKGRGLAPDGDGTTTAAEEHGAGRAESGFTVEQMVSEFRALRASVIRLWTAARAGGRDGASGALDATAVEDLTRFHEAIDQALAESVTRYTQDINESKEMFLAILGHDLRTPLGATLMASRFMLDTEELPEPHATLAARIATSSTRMLQMVGDLLDFTRSRLGGGSHHPGRRQRRQGGARRRRRAGRPAPASHAHGRRARRPARGVGRGPHQPGPRQSAGQRARARHRGRARRVEIRGTPDDVTIAIHNRGPTIPAALIEGIFRPMKGREARANAAATGPLGNWGSGSTSPTASSTRTAGASPSSPRPRAGRRSPCTCRGAHERADPDDRTAGAQLAWATAHVEYTGGDADQQRPARRAVGRYRAAQPDSSLHRAGGAQGPPAHLQPRRPPPAWLPTPARPRVDPALTVRVRRARTRVDGTEDPCALSQRHPTRIAAAAPSRDGLKHCWRPARCRVPSSTAPTSPASRPTRRGSSRSSTSAPSACSATPRRRS